MDVTNSRFDLAIVGAGAVGLATALWAQEADLSVALIDRGEPGAGASFGNRDHTLDCSRSTLPALARLATLYGRLIL